ncbi:MAG: SMP-30/gluconolactonase/LRE family protein [Mycobacterium sp.]|nr:SMP-30/gluconolactonase/LRE family protein [Mycobacterium sp.]
MSDAEKFTGVVANHGEGPFWDAPTRRFLMVDLLAGAIVAVASDGIVTRHPVPSSVASVIRRRRSGGLVIATEGGVVVCDEQFVEFRKFADLALDPTVRTNDGGCGPSGDFFVGTMAFDGRPGGGALYRLTPEGRVVEMLGGVSISNGLQWSGDGSRVFYIDSLTHRVDVFDVDPESGEWFGRRPHIQIDDSSGVPDGMAIDEQDGLWIALWGGGAVNHYDRTGRLVETVKVSGVSQVSSCAFGGVDRDVLYITTSRQGLSDDREPNAGAVFAFPTNVRGAVLPDFFG